MGNYSTFISAMNFKTEIVVLLLFLSLSYCRARNGGTIVATNMAVSMQNEAMLTAREAMVKFSDWDAVRLHVENHLNSVYGSAWNCLIGKSNTFSFNEKIPMKKFIYFKIDGADAMVHHSDGDTGQRLERLETELKRSETYLNQARTEVIANQALEECHSAALAAADSAIDSILEAQAGCHQNDMCQRRLFLLQSQSISALSLQPLIEYTQIDKAQRSLLRSLEIRFSNDSQFLSEAVNITATAIALDIIPNLQQVSNEIIDRFKTKYPSFRFYCFVLDRDPEYGIGYSPYLDHYATFSIQGITVTVIRALNH
ncbi:hypothetical protein HDE_06181 [Halotydeus destructor]|nr:hypothetical protein HDE_06181 [Halotydeus destructor]